MMVRWSISLSQIVICLPRSQTIKFEEPTAMPLPSVHCTIKGQFEGPTAMCLPSVHCPIKGQFEGPTAKSLPSVHCPIKGQYEGPTAMPLPSVHCPMSNQAIDPALVFHHSVAPDMLVDLLVYYEICDNLPNSARDSITRSVGRSVY